jgi:hypothetical protein
LIATNTLALAMLDLLAADTATLANAAALHLHLAKNSFTPAPGLTLAGLTEADFTGATALDAGIGAQNVFYDPVRQAYVLQILEPAGGWHWDCTVTPAPSQTIFGVYLTDNADAVLYGSQLLPVPVLISAAGQGLDFANAPFVAQGIPFLPAQ